MTLSVAAVLTWPNRGEAVLLSDGSTYGLTYRGEWERLDPLPGTPAARAEGERRDGPVPPEDTYPADDEYEDLEDVVARLKREGKLADD